TDVEFVTHYLINKVIYNPFSSFIFQEINATELYTKSPKNSDEPNDEIKTWTCGRAMHHRWEILMPK
ncbi:hypothetical protein Gohar_005292, partial [Gossypium harknessii]|nr:hypothetical protein [Gossypium harknessii]